MKRWSVVVLVVALTLTVVPLAAAGSGGGAAKGKSKFNLVGKVVAVDGAAGSLTVRVKAGAKTVKGFRGVDLALVLALVVDPAARVRLVTADGCVAALLGDVPVGAKVKVRGRIDRTDPAAPPVYVALCVKAKAPVAPELTPTP